MTHLYELTEQHRQLAVLSEEGDEDIKQAIADTFEALEGEFNDKAIALIQVAENIDSDINMVDLMIKKLQGRKLVLQNRKEHMREYLKSNMEACEISKIECPYFAITLAKGRDMAVIDDPELLPDEYVDIEMNIKPKKRDILRALKAGELIPGAHIEKSKTSLRIK